MLPKKIICINLKKTFQSAEAFRYEQAEPVT
jgi:hypothetical protein